MGDKPELVDIAGWAVKILQPDGPSQPRFFLLLHGWTGDENSMWVFASRLPRTWLLAAPRAPYVSRHPKHGGYSWVTEQSGDFPSYEELGPAMKDLAGLLGALEAKYPHAEDGRIDLAGFSQGAALAARFALDSPGRIHRLALLAGFLPEGTPASAGGGALKGLRTFIAHGRQDETVPVERARQAVTRFEDDGAVVTYCESDSGHKLSAECFRAFRAHFTDQD